MINQFKNDYSWLSNFAPCSIIIDGIIYPSVEHAYMSAKSNDTEWKDFCRITKSASTVKKVSHDISLIPEWDSIKLEVMKKCLYQKYKQSPYYEKLLETKNEEIIEGNYWHDIFWGIDLNTNTGENNLGKLIMEIREEICK